MDYYFQDGDAKTPAAFLKELAPVSGSSLVQAKMVFNSSFPVPSESFVLRSIQSLQRNQLTNQTDSVKILNVTYEKISNTSYAVTFTFNISNISMPKNPDLKNKTFNQVEIIINNALNALLNKPGAEQFKPNSFNFMSSENQIIGHMEYYFQDIGTTTPEAFLNEIAPILGNVMIKIRLVFKNLSKIPSKTDVLNAANTLLDTKIRRTRDLTTQKLNEPVSISDVLYEIIDNSSYSISFEFQISNVTVSKDLQLRNETYDLIQNTINTLLNTILNAKDAPPFVFPRANYTFNSTMIIADSEYIFVEGVSQWTSSGFLSAILNINVLSTTAFPASTKPVTSTSQSNTSIILGNVMIKIRLVFKNLSKIPSKTDVLNAAHTLLDAKIIKARDLTTQKLNEPVSINDVLFEIIDNSSYSISFEFKISDVTISKDLQLRNETYELIQNTTNTLLNTILNAKNAPPFVFPWANYTFNGTAIIADSEYIFVEGVIKWTPGEFLSKLLQISGLSDSTTTAAPVTAVQTATVQGNTTTTGGSSAWILGIIIPCAIIVILIPCWILLCCLLCGCCAGLRRRYNRRRSYTIQHYT
ncbi:uncharacterized protein LOC128528605 [Clarias gariepinus]|uniref:uncharacterized protein LOC128528605 n=1 Tax=Clarias gariepinus TaxID=13013 RepID=UPI00234D648C|nr:uncharacterized protein LOC128528605 [Clarias gariepinus]